MELAIETNDQLSQFMRKLLSLPLIPAVSIQPTLDLLKTHLPPDLLQIVQPVVIHFETYWLQTVGADGISVYDAVRRTNNNLEALNRVLRDWIGLQPQLWHFLSKYL